MDRVIEGIITEIRAANEFLNGLEKMIQAMQDIPAIGDKFQKQRSNFIKEAVKKIDEYTESHKELHLLALEIMEHNDNTNRVKAMMHDILEKIASENTDTVN